MLQASRDGRAKDMIALMEEGARIDFEDEVFMSFFFQSHVEFHFIRLVPCILLYHNFCVCVFVCACV